MKLLTIAAVASTIMLGGCASYGWSPLAVTLPDWPAECRQVQVADPRKGEDKLAYAARERAGRLQANGTIQACAGWYTDVKSYYGAP